MTTEPIKIQTDNLTVESVNVTNVTNTTSGPDLTWRNPLVNVEIIVQAIIFILALFGNSFVLCYLGRLRKKLSRMHMFILHLSIADILVAFLNILPQLIWDITFRWKLGGDIGCRFFKFTQVFVMYLSTYILVLTALDRRKAVCSPLSSHTLTMKVVHIEVAAAYVISALLSIPQAIIFKYQEIVQGSNTYDCWVKFNPEWTLPFYITSFAVLVYIGPLFVLIFAYGSIVYVVFGRGKLSTPSKMVQTDTPSHSRYSDHDVVDNKDSHVTSPMRGQRVTASLRSNTPYSFSKAKLNTIKMTLVIVTAYIVCWSPFFVSQLWWLYDESAPRSNNAMVIMLVLASLNSCCNPWIYLGFNPSIKRSLKRFGVCCKGSSMENNASMSSRSMSGRTQRRRPLEALYSSASTKVISFCEDDGLMIKTTET